MPVKVLHVITKLELGGAQKHVLQLLKGLDPEKFETYLVSSPSLLDEEARKIVGGRLTLWRSWVRPIHPFLDLFVLVRLFFYIKRRKFSIVHTHSSKAGILARWAGRWARVPVIIHTVHGWGFHDFLKGFVNDLYIGLERAAAKNATKLIVVSAFDREKGLRHGIGRPEQYALIRCAPDPACDGAVPEDVDRLRQEVGARPQDLFVGMVACLKPQKNPADFVQAARRVAEAEPAAKFILVGDGALRRAVTRKIEECGLGDRFFMLGWRRDVRPVMTLVDILVLTSLWEGLPLALLEAMRYAKPVVAYDVCGVHEVVRDGVNGFLAQPQDAEDMAGKIVRLLGDRQLRQRMGQFGQRIVSQNAFSCDRMVRQIEDLYRDCLLNKGGDR